MKYECGNCISGELPDGTVFRGKILEIFETLELAWYRCDVYASMHGTDTHLKDVPIMEKTILGFCDSKDCSSCRLRFICYTT